MKYSEIALFLLAAKETKLIKSNAKFWKEYNDINFLKENIAQNQELKVAMNKLRKKLNVSYDFDGFICPFDSEFPVINHNVKKNSEKPFLIFYKGDISLLKNINDNVAVIGCTDPSPEVVEREQNFVKQLIDTESIIVSGLAKGCDSIAHAVAVTNRKPTIAILPSAIEKIYPKENRQLAADIIKAEGLIITEYYKEPESKFEAINRFIERDRLQAMFSKVIVLTASYRKNEGDSGSRHAMEYARNYKLNRYVMLNKGDINNIQFGLNIDIKNDDSAVKSLTLNSIEEIKDFELNFAETETTQMELLKF